MDENTLFPREEKTDVLFNKILNDPWAYNKLFQTFCDNLFCKSVKSGFYSAVMMLLLQHFHHCNSPNHYSTAIPIKIYLHFLWL